MRSLSLISIVIMAWVITGCGNNIGEQEPLNVILIITDDQGYGDLAFHGNSDIETPVLDQLVKESVEFTRFYVSPVCAPTRASLLTGRYHLRTGTSWVTHRKEVMRSEEVTIAEVFKDIGYQTGLFGKWHNGKQYPHDPIGQGFDRFVGFKDGHLNNYFDPIFTDQFEEIRMKGFASDIITDRAIAFMQAQKKPFFSMISYNTPHSPFQVADEYFDKYKSQGLNDKDATVYGMVENIDDNIGRIRQHLQENGLAKNTIILFMTDNGPNGWRYNNGLKGRKAHVDEGGVRVPFMLHHPQKPDWENKKISQMTAHIDVLPTLADLLEFELSDDLQLDGISLSPLLSGSSIEDRYFYTHQVSWDFDTIPGAIRSNEYVLTRKPEGDELYALLSDSIQQYDLTNEKPELVKELKQHYEQWLTEVTKKSLTPPPIEIGHPGIPLVEFPAPDASEIINLKFKGGSGWANDWFTGWQDGSQASWKVKAVSNMEYMVHLELSAPEAYGQLFMLSSGEKELPVRIESPAIAKKIENRDRVKRGEVEERVWPIIKIGTLRLTPGFHTITLTANLAMDSLVEVKSIKMIPTTDRTNT